MQSRIVDKMFSTRNINSKVYLFYFLIILLCVNYITSEEECGFEKYRLKNYLKYEEEGDEKPLRFLENQPFEPIRVVVDYMSLDKQQSISGTLKAKVKEIVETAKKVIENLVKVRRMTRKLVVKGCNNFVSISDDIKVNGVDADLVIFPYVDAQMQGTTQAYASPCVISAKNNRPIAGFIGFTQTINFDKNNWLEYYTNIAIHELTHVLGFNSDLFDFFVDENEKPIPIDKIVQETEIDGVKRKIIVSPKALDAARKHFNCPDMKGIELENQGGEGTLGSHWESRVMLTEYMVGFTYDEATLSEITLAFLEDTGWYKTNYFTGGLFRYGKNGGCSFLQEKCVVDGKIKHKNEFCNERLSPICTAGRLNKGFCYISNYPSDIDPNFRYFSKMNEGGMAFADYCPVSGVPSNKEYFLPWSCTNGIINQYPVEFEEEISKDSACFLSSLISKENQEKFLPDQTRALCHKYNCDFDQKKYNVTIGKNVFECPTKGGYVEIESYAGTFNCARFDLICTSEIRCTNLVECALKKAVSVSFQTDISDTTEDSNTPSPPTDNLHPSNGDNENTGNNNDPTVHVNAFNLSINIFVLFVITFLLIR
jgi:hypothetical protein